MGTIQQLNQKNKGKKFSSSLLYGFFVMITILILLMYYNILARVHHGQQQSTSSGSIASGSSSSTSRSKSISCSEVQDNTNKGIWHDPNLGQLFSRQLIVQPSFQISVHNKSYDPVRWDWLYEKGKYYEDEVHERFVRILGSQQASPNDIVLDVGANIGYYSLLSQAMGYNVMAFEINPANLIRICESIQLNSDAKSKITLYQRGVSNLDDIPLQVIVPKNPGQAFMRDLTDEKELRKVQSTNETSTHHAFTTTITLDSFANQMGWLGSASKTAKIRLLKLDVEGKEPQIIEGAKQLLSSGKVLNVLTEFRRLLRPSIQEAITTLFDSGYTLVKDDDTTSGEKPKLLTRKESKAVLDELAAKYRGKGKNFDFWFQLNNT